MLNAALNYTRSSIILLHTHKDVNCKTSMSFYEEILKKTFFKMVRLLTSVHGQPSIPLYIQGNSVITSSLIMRYCF